jgi:hypothetical protein
MPSTFKLYPNPVNNELSIESQVNINLIEVYSIMGQLLQTLNPQSKVIKINVSTYEQGVYLVFDIQLKEKLLLRE